VNQHSLSTIQNNGTSIKRNGPKNTNRPSNHFCIMAHRSREPERTSIYGYSKERMASRGPNQYEYPTGSTARERYLKEEEVEEEEVLTAEMEELLEEEEEEEEEEDACLTAEMEELLKEEEEEEAGLIQVMEELLDEEERKQMEIQDLVPVVDDQLQTDGEYENDEEEQLNCSDYEGKEGEEFNDSGS
jgi:hypothetical protein